MIEFLLTIAVWILGAGIGQGIVQATHKDHSAIGLREWQVLMAIWPVSVPVLFAGLIIKIIAAVIQKIAGQVEKIVRTFWKRK